MLEIFIQGGPVMYPLLLCSIVSLTVIVERIIYWVTLDLNRQNDLIEEILEHCRLGDWDTVRQKSAGTRNPVLRVLVSGILHRDYNLSKAMESAAMDQMKAMKRFMGILDTIITVAPLLGIFGTVTGIILSFEMLGSAGIEDPKAVTSGIAQALITTAAGLGIAILTVFPYNYFNSRVESAAVSIETYATRLEIVCNGKPADGTAGDEGAR
jgi:biopolymer transport protein ExbB